MSKKQRRVDVGKFFDNFLYLVLLMLMHSLGWGIIFSTFLSPDQLTGYSLFAGFCSALMWAGREK